MAKRIKIKGKTPRGLSKSDRVLENRGKLVEKIASRDPDHPGIPFPSRARLKDTAPSSTRKKLVKEGNRKFIGPRQFKSELAEDNIARAWEKLGPDDDFVSKQDSIRNVRKKRVPRKNEIVREFGASLGQDKDEFGVHYGRGSISKNKRLMRLLSKLLKRHIEGAAELGIARGKGPFDVPLREYDRYLAEFRAFGND